MTAGCMVDSCHERTLTCQYVVDDAARLNWDGIADLDSAQISFYRSHSSGGPHLLVETLDGGDVNFDDEPGNGFYCYVITLVRDGVESGNSNGVCGSTAP